MAPVESTLQVGSTDGQDHTLLILLAKTDSDQHSKAREKVASASPFSSLLKLAAEINISTTGILPMRILVVEDDAKVAGFIKKGLIEENYAVDTFCNGEDALFWATENEYDLIILDIMLPGKDGLSICRELRKKEIVTPIMMLTAKDTTADKIKGLDVGADDYLGKPFSFDEFLARIRALLRRSQEYKEPLLKVADLEMNPALRTVTRAGKAITLTGKEYALLEFFLRNKGRILSETRIVEHVWDMNYDPETNVVGVYIHHLRSKIDKGFEKKLIHTIRGTGYQIKDDEA
jgi:two-component system copper resistance phosphate regulon response regulator CusR